MSDTAPQTAAGKVLLHFTMSLDGFVAGPDHAMDWMTGLSVRPGLIQEYVDSTGAVLGARDGWDINEGATRPYGGAWDGPVFVLTHHPEDATPADGSRSWTVTRPKRYGSGWPRRAAKTSRCSRPASADSSWTAGSSTRSTCTSRPSC